ncbi:MAG: glycosyltransferase involved in cell wall biosynthesis [Rickettsiales bacterium]|jgi:glycosyltransferase involved in cell wall biosynthesis
MIKTVFNIVQSEAKGGGMENIFFDYSRIIQNNKNVRLICLVPEKFCHLESLKQENIKIEFLRIRGHFDIFASLKLFFLIKKYSPELIIAHNGRSFAAVNLCKKLIGNFKSIAVSHGGSIKRTLGFDRIICVANHIEKRVVKENFKGDCATIFNGHKIVPFVKDKTSEIFTFGILSRISKEKNIDGAIRQFQKFHSQINQNSRLIIAGKGYEEENLKKLVNTLNLTNVVDFIGWSKNKSDFFNKIDVFLQPALNEPFGITILESFNYQTLVVACNSDGPKEIIKNGFSGYLFKIDDENSLFEAMKKSYLNQDDSNNIIKNASLELEKKFSFEVMQSKLLDYLSF